MRSTHLESFRLLERLAGRCDKVCVSYSGGKDSVVVLDLAVRVFGVERLRAFFKYTVPGLAVEQVGIRWAEERYGLRIEQVPRLSFFFWKWRGVFSDPTPELGEFLNHDPPLKWVMAWGLQITGCRELLTGMKDSDGLKRRQFFANCRDSRDPFWRHVHHPIRHWRKADVLGWIDRHGLFRADVHSAGAVTAGVGLQHQGLCWLHDRHPEDFRRLEVWFPYIGACVKRRDWYGVGVDGEAEPAAREEDGIVIEEG